MKELIIRSGISPSFKANSSSIISSENHHQVWAHRLLVVHGWSSLAEQPWQPINLQLNCPLSQHRVILNNCNLRFQARNSLNKGLFYNLIAAILSPEEAESTSTQIYWTCRCNFSACRSDLRYDGSFGSMLEWIGRTFEKAGRTDLRYDGSGSVELLMKWVGRISLIAGRSEKNWSSITETFGSKIAAFDPIQAATISARQHRGTVLECPREGEPNTLVCAFQSEVER